MRNLLYMFNQRSTKYVLPVFFIGTLFLSFSSINIFCRPPSLLLTSSTINNDNNNNYCNSNEFLVSATNIRSKNRRQATKQHGLIEPSVAYDMHVPYVAEPIENSAGPTVGTPSSPGGNSGSPGNNANKNNNNNNNNNNNAAAGGGSQLRSNSAGGSTPAGGGSNRWRRRI